MRIAALLVGVLFGVSTASADMPATKLSRIAKGLRDPVRIGTLPDRSQRLYVAEKRGRIRILRGDTFDRDLLDIEDILDPSINGALASVTFPNNYDLTKQFFVTFSDKQSDTIIATFKAREGHPNDEDDIQVVLKVAQPSSTSHSSSLQFGPDGYLYAGIADVREGTDNGANAQNPRSLLGKILRLDISNPANYSSPPSNPFAKRNTHAPEIWALGFQNPTNISFHPSTNKLYVVDSGKRFQEINLVEAGKNYGWNILEGTSCVKSPCASTPTTPPAYEQASSALRGGFAYRGKSFPSLVGQLVVSEIGSTEVKVLSERDGTWGKETLLSTEKPIAALGETNDGELLVATVDGVLYSVVGG
jgi:glucose/arabinose dehydrogenase